MPRHRSCPAGRQPSASRRRWNPSRSPGERRSHSICLAGQLRHEGSLVGPYAMFPRDRSAETQTDAKNLAGDILGKLLLSRYFGVVQDERMEIAVAGMKDVGDAQSGLSRECLDLTEDSGDVRARDDSVLHDL